MKKGRLQEPLTLIIEAFSAGLAIPEESVLYLFAEESKGLIKLLINPKPTGVSMALDLMIDGIDQFMGVIDKDEKDAQVARQILSRMANGILSKNPEVASKIIELFASLLEIESKYPNVCHFLMRNMVSEGEVFFNAIKIAALMGIGIESDLSRIFKSHSFLSNFTNLIKKQLLDEHCNQLYQNLQSTARIMKYLDRQLLKIFMGEISEDIINRISGSGLISLRGTGSNWSWSSKAKNITFNQPKTIINIVHLGGVIRFILSSLEFETNENIFTIPESKVKLIPQAMSSLFMNKSFNFPCKLEILINLLELFFYTILDKDSVVTTSVDGLKVLNKKSITLRTLMLSNLENTLIFLLFFSGYESEYQVFLINTILEFIQRIEDQTSKSTISCRRLVSSTYKTALGTNRAVFMEKVDISFFQFVGYCANSSITESLGKRVVHDLIDILYALLSHPVYSHLSANLLFEIVDRMSISVRSPDLIVRYVKLLIREMISTNFSSLYRQLNLKSSLVIVTKVSYLLELLDVFSSKTEDKELRKQVASTLQTIHEISTSFPFSKRLIVVLTNVLKSKEDAIPPRISSSLLRSHSRSQRSKRRSLKAKSRNILSINRQVSNSVEYKEELAVSNRMNDTSSPNFGQVSQISKTQSFHYNGDAQSLKATKDEMIAECVDRAMHIHQELKAKRIEKLRKKGVEFPEDGPSFKPDTNKYVIAEMRIINPIDRNGGFLKNEEEYSAIKYHFSLDLESTLHAKSLKLYLAQNNTVLRRIFYFLVSHGNKSVIWNGVEYVQFGTLSWFFNKLNYMFIQPDALQSIAKPEEDKGKHIRTKLLGEKKIDYYQNPYNKERLLKLYDKKSYKTKTYYIKLKELEKLLKRCERGEAKGKPLNTLSFYGMKMLLLSYFDLLIRKARVSCLIIEMLEGFLDRVEETFQNEFNLVRTTNSIYEDMEVIAYLESQLGEIESHETSELIPESLADQELNSLQLKSMNSTMAHIEITNIPINYEVYWKEEYSISYPEEPPLANFSTIPESYRVANSILARILQSSFGINLYDRVISIQKKRRIRGKRIELRKTSSNSNQPNKDKRSYELRAYSKLDFPHRLVLADTESSEWHFCLDIANCLQEMVEFVSLDQQADLKNFSLEEKSPQIINSVIKKRLEAQELSEQKEEDRARRFLARKRELSQLLKASSRNIKESSLPPKLSSTPNKLRNTAYLQKLKNKVLKIQQEKELKLKQDSELASKSLTQKLDARRKSFKRFNQMKIAEYTKSFELKKPKQLTPLKPKPDLKAIEIAKQALLLEKELRTRIEGIFDELFDYGVVDYSFEELAKKTHLKLEFFNVDGFIEKIAEEKHVLEFFRVTFVGEFGMRLLDIQKLANYVRRTAKRLGNLNRKEFDFLTKQIIVQAILNELKKDDQQEEHSTSKEVIASFCKKINESSSILQASENKPNKDENEPGEVVEPEKEGSAVDADQINTSEANPQEVGESEENNEF